MTNLNSLKEKINKEDLKVLVCNPSKLLTEFFNGLVIHIDEKCSYES